jgi:ABC-type phosphate transport system substrate-binding protein
VSLRRVFLLALLLLSAATFALAKDVALIANKGGSVSTISIPELVKLCKAQTNRWPDGKSVTLVMRDPGSPEMKMVLEKIYSMAPEAVNELIATANHGRMNHPAILVVNSDDEIVKKVAGTPGAVGLVDVYAINSSVDVMKVAGKLPFEPGYPLHGN